MMKAKYSTIYSATTDGITEILFLNPTALSKINYETIRSIEAGNTVIKDCLDNVIPANIAASTLNELVSYSNEFIRQLNSESVDNPTLKFTMQCGWNISAGSLIISIVRAHMLQVGLTQFGLNPLIMAAKLSQLIALMQVGMFAESIMLINSIERDGFLTDDRIAKYILMLTSANAIND